MASEHLDQRQTDLLLELLRAPGPSGYEHEAAAVWRTAARDFAGKVIGDVHGSAAAGINLDGRPRIVLAGHVDEIGLMVSHVDDKGYLYVAAIGGWDAQVVVGQRVTVLGRDGRVSAVVGRKPIHLLEGDERDRPVKLKDLFLDIGARSKDEALECVRVGDAAVLAAEPLELPGGRVVSRALDNRISAFIVLETLRELAAAPEGLRAEAWSTANAQEEICRSGGGIAPLLYALEPEVVVVVDVTHATDHPGADERVVGSHPLGTGPVLTRGSAVSPRVFDRLERAAEAADVKVTLEANPSYTSTDADLTHTVRSGIATGLIGIPLRYMHSPNELVDLADVRAAIRLLVQFCRSLGPDDSFVIE